MVSWFITFPIGTSKSTLSTTAGCRLKVWYIAAFPVTSLRWCGYCTREGDSGTGDEGLGEMKS